MDTVQNGKGSRPRPIADKDKFESNWDAIFGTKPRDKEAEHEREQRQNNGK